MAYSSGDFAAGDSAAAAVDSAGDFVADVEDYSGDNSGKTSPSEKIIE